MATWKISICLLNVLPSINKADCDYYYYPHNSPYLHDMKNYSSYSTYLELQYTNNITYHTKTGTLSPWSSVIAFEYEQSTIHISNC